MSVVMVRGSKERQKIESMPIWRSLLSLCCRGGQEMCWLLGEGQHHGELESPTNLTELLWGESWPWTYKEIASSGVLETMQLPWSHLWLMIFPASAKCRSRGGGWLACSRVGFLLARWDRRTKMRVFARQWCVKGISLEAWAGGG